MIKHYHSIETIAVIRSPFKEKFGIPRQSGLLPEHHCRVEMLPPFNTPDAFRALEGFSHLWLIFMFHQNLGHEWRPTIRPPRLGGNKRVGVFASRSSFRPNGLGLSVVKLEKICQSDGNLSLEISGADLIDGTPIVDIKPYIAFVDALENTVAGYVEEAPGNRVGVHFSHAARTALHRLDANQYPSIEKLITEALAKDPRPAYQRLQESREYGMRLYDLNIRFKGYEHHIEVVSITKA
ncbi:MAG: tRNA (N6-threonylcarbamoyladenosine(37)-N6)-methyltransferase TrmO [Hahellaceae bacterium]|nr:tRNA (N6-threonylcarbamoyladenosine(37)-N6)-methyltransferase TrmO [Hahellaceae bacterium]MCP5169075.1 tRNA (N6-threonylcarbamoyladenosine(37)-N6)-methyltransferase TrmO [Hahellaceae bacterium]